LAQDQPDLVGKAIDKAAKGGQRAQTICQALLGLCRGPKQRVTVEMTDLVDEAVSAMVRHPSRDGIELDVRVAPGKVTTRSVELQQVLLNLLLNARRAVLAGRGRRWIEMAAEQIDGQWVIRVADGGVGIPTGDVERVFEPFYSTADSDAGDGGFGLGLTICREIVQSLGGTIHADGTVVRGACFEIHLPAA
jgi:signal transduction histidine kinase